MQLDQLIRDNFLQSIATKEQVLDSMLPSIVQAVELIVKTFKSGNKLLICGNGGSAADAQHLAAEFTGRYEMERPPLPAIALTTDTSALTAIGNDYGFDMVFAKQVAALATKGDVLLAISTSGNSVNVIKAIEVARTKQVAVIALVGRDGGKIAQWLQEGDVNLCVAVERTARIQEVHILVIHSLCDAIDQVLFKQ